MLAIGHECDVALLTVDDDEFWEGFGSGEEGNVDHHMAIRLVEELPLLQDEVTVVGYPVGGDTMSVTSGIVSRIEVTSYVHGMAELLGIQVDAAINSGNSGGPAFNAEGDCVGIAFQSLKTEAAENVGYVVPVPVIRHFLLDVERTGHYNGFPMLGVAWQKLENPQLRRALGMEDAKRGVLVRRVDATSPAARFIQAGDVLCSFDGVEIGNDGTVPFRSGERISFTYLVSRKMVGDTAAVVLLRSDRLASDERSRCSDGSTDDGSTDDVVVDQDAVAPAGPPFTLASSGGDAWTSSRAERIEVTVPLGAPFRLVPTHTSDNPPSYFILAGRVRGQKGRDWGAA